MTAIRKRALLLLVLISLAGGAVWVDAQTSGVIAMPAVQIARTLFAGGSNDQVWTKDSTQVFGGRWAAAGGSAARAIGFLIDGGGSVITTGFKGCTEVPFAGTITAARIFAVDAGSPTSGSIVVDLWKDTYANYPPTDADSITASAPPTLSSATKNEDTTLTGWTTSIAAGNFVCANVDSATTVLKVQVQLTVTPS